MKNNERIIFLDIDGVLNYRICPKENKLFHDIGHWVCKEKIDLLNIVNINVDDLRFVITSTWRLSFTLEEMQRMFKLFGFEGDIVGCTPVLTHKYSMRGNEIFGYIHSIGCNTLYNNYIILDDDSDMLYWQKDNFIHVDNYVGITPRTVFLIENFFR